MHSLDKSLVVLATALLTAGLACSKEKEGAGKGDAKASASATAEDDAKAEKKANRKKIRKAKDEALPNLGAISRSAAAAFEREQMVEALDADGEAVAHKLPETTDAVPASLEEVKGKSYTPKTEDWDSWKELKFMLSDPMLCQYQWIKEDERSGRAVVKCDADGDGELDIHFERAATVSGEGADIRMKMAPTVDEKVNALDD